MKRILLLIVILTLWSAPTFGQDSDLITLDNTVPGLDVIITNPENTTGVISLELDNVGVTVTDSLGEAIFQMRDPRTHMAELRFAPNTGTHTLTVERLPGVNEAHVMINALAELTSSSTAVEVEADAIALEQKRNLMLSNAAPGHTLSLALPEETIGTLNSELPGAAVSAQLVDGAGMAIATLSSGHIDGLNLTLEGGKYGLTLLNTNPAIDTTANIQVMSARALTLDTLLPPTTTLAIEETTNVEAEPVDTAVVAACTTTIGVSSINMRSGPGPGYSVTEFGYRGDELVVGGYNPDHSWVLVGTDSGSAWIAGRLGQLSGDCGTLPVFDIPYKNAVEPQVIVQQPEAQVIYQNVPASGGQSSGRSSSHDDDNESSGSHGGDDD